MNKKILYTFSRFLFIGSIYFSILALPFLTSPIFAQVVTGALGGTPGNNSSCAGSGGTGGLSGTAGSAGEASSCGTVNTGGSSGSAGVSANGGPGGNGGGVTSMSANSSTGSLNFYGGGGGGGGGGNAGFSGGVGGRGGRISASVSARDNSSVTVYGGGGGGGGEAKGAGKTGGTGGEGGGIGSGISTNDNGSVWFYGGNGGNGGKGLAGAAGGTGGPGGEVTGSVFNNGTLISINPGKGGKGGDSCGGVGSDGQNGSGNNGGAGGAGGPACASPTAVCNGNGTVTWTWPASTGASPTSVARLQIYDSTGTGIPLYDKKHTGSATTAVTGTQKGHITYYNNTNIASGQTTITCGAGGGGGAGNIANLNFAINNSTSWIQGYNLDMRFDSGFANDVPTSNYALATNSSHGTTPGVIFIGDGFADFGSGQASSKNWVVGGSSYAELFNFPSSGGLSTSYGYLNANATRAGITPTVLTTAAAHCGAGGIANCTLSATLPHGIYKANGNLALNAFTVPANGNYVFLVNGNLTIKNNITVPTGSTVIFSANGTITVNSTVGIAANSVPASGQVQGMYVAGTDFIVNGSSNCPGTADNMLNIDGSVVVNSNGTDGSLINNRNLCSNNSNFSSFTVSPRLDFILNAPDFIKRQNIISSETAP